MFKKELTYSYNDVAIVPASVSTIKHRSDCNVYINNKLPIFTAPMSTVINEENFEIFNNEHLNVIMPRNISLGIRRSYLHNGHWVAMSITEFEDFVITTNTKNKIPYHICIDVANGNMDRIFSIAKTAKEKFGMDGIILMSGNIANPKTYLEYCKAGIDYVRCSVGSGCGCITATQTAIHYGIASLINEVYKLKELVDGELGLFSEYKTLTKIIADGGIRGYADVIKALALGADYVMIGSVLAQTIESAAKTYYKHPINPNEIVPLDVLNHNVVCREKEGVYSITTQEDNEDDFKIIPQPYKVFYGMASKQGQQDLFGKKKATAEGITKRLPVTTNLNKWVKNMEDYLKSAMSYCNIKDVKDFNCGNVDTILISNNTNNSVNK